MENIAWFIIRQQHELKRGRQLLKHCKSAGGAEDAGDMLEPISPLASFLEVPELVPENLTSGHSW